MLQILVAESYGGRDEPVDTIIGSCVTASADTTLDPLRVRDTPTELTYQVHASFTLLKVNSYLVGSFLDHHCQVWRTLLQTAALCWVCHC